MKVITTAAKEWAQFCALETSHEKLSFAKNMRDAVNRQAALRGLGHGTAKDKRETSARQRAISEVTKAELRNHCQFEGLVKLH